VAGKVDSFLSCVYGANYRVTRRKLC